MFSTKRRSTKQPIIDYPSISESFKLFIKLIKFLMNSNHWKIVIMENRLSVVWSNDVWSKTFSRIFFAEYVSPKIRFAENTFAENVSPNTFRRKYVWSKIRFAENVSPNTFRRKYVWSKTFRRKYVWSKMLFDRIMIRN